MAWMKWHLHHGIHGGLDQLWSTRDHGWAPGHHTGRSRHRVHPRHDGSHVILLLFDSVLFYKLGVLFLLFTDLQLKEQHVSFGKVLAVLLAINKVRKDKGSALESLVI